MSTDYPSFFGPPAVEYRTLASVPLSRAERREYRQPGPEPVTPSWLTVHPPREPKRMVTKEERSLMLVQFEMVLPHILEQICAGDTIDGAINRLRPLMHLDVGAFLRWLKKRPEWALYQEMREIRTEVWTGKMLQHAKGVQEDGVTPSPSDVSRDKLAVDTYWKLIQAQNKKEYGDTKQIEINQQISIIGALDAARARARTVIDVEAEVVEFNGIREMRQLSAEDEDEDE